jgi:hypothetical protein
MSLVDFDASVCAIKCFQKYKGKGAAQAKKGLRKNNCSASLVPEIFKSHQR